MREIFRKKLHKIVTIGIISIIALVFALWGLGDYFTMGGGRSTAAIIDGKKLSWKTVDEVYQRLQKHFGADANERELKQQLRIALIQRIALLANAKSLGFEIGEEQLAQSLVQMPAFQVDGKFSKEKYLDIVSKAGYRDAEFRHELAQDLTIAQLEQGLMQSNFSLGSELTRLVSLLDQKRDFGYVVLSAKDYRKDIKIGLEDIQAYYDKHKTNFIIPEQVSLEYVTLSVDNLAKPIEVSEKEAKSYYDQHIAFYTAPESVHARHILLAVPASSSSKEVDDKALAKMREILAELKKGADFNKLAKQYSQDQGSAVNGGDLGWFTRGQMVPEFEKASFALKRKNDISEPIRTQFGYHIVQLLDKKAKEERPFEEVKSLVKEQYQREKAQEIYTEQMDEMTKLAYEHSDSLISLTQKLNLKLESTDMFSRQGGKSDLTAHPAVLKAVFSDEVLAKKHNSEPIRLNDNMAVVVRLKEHKPAEQQTLELATAKITEILTSERALAKVKELGQNFAKQLQNKASIQKLAMDQKLKWIEKKAVARTSTDLDSAIINAAFQAKHPEEGRASIESFALPTGDTVVLAITKVYPGSLDTVDEQTQIGYKKGLSEILSQLEFSLYANQVYNQVKVEFPDAPKNP